MDEDDIGERDDALRHLKNILKATCTPRQRMAAKHCLAGLDNAGDDFPKPIIIVREKLREALADKR